MKLKDLLCVFPYPSSVGLSVLYPGEDIDNNVLDFFSDEVFAGDKEDVPSLYFDYDVHLVSTNKISGDTFLDFFVYLRSKEISKIWHYE